MLTKYSITTEAFSREKELALSSMKSRDLNPASLISTRSEEKFLIDTGYAHPVIGYKKTIELLDLEKVILHIEKIINKMNETLPPLEEFILPGGDEFCARIHVSRAVCRRAERSCISLVKAGDNKKNWLPYLNRLSDFLFVLVRYTNQIQGVNETLWVR